MKKTVVKTTKVGHERLPLEGFTINPDKLESEALRQLTLMQEYSELAAEAVYQVARLENKKTRIRSEILLKNQNVAKNAQIAEAMYRADKEYIAVTVALSEAIYKQERLQNAMYLLAQRRDMIDFFSRRNSAQSANYDVPKIIGGFNCL